MVTLISPHTDSRGKAIPINFRCFIMLGDKYLCQNKPENQEPYYYYFSHDKTNAIVVSNKTQAKNYIKKYLPKGRVVPLTNADYEELRALALSSVSVKEVA